MRIGFFAGIAAVALAVVSLSAQVDQRKLTNPLAVNETAPATFKVNMDTSKGMVVITVHRDWAPKGADRFYGLVKYGFFDDVRFYRVLDGFMAQFGIHGTPTIDKAWMNANIQDDPVKQSNTRGRVTYAKSGAPNSRSTQLFINFGDNASLDKQGFAPIGEVTSGMNVVDKLYSGYGEGGDMGGKGPMQSTFHAQGNAYLEKSFPKLDYIKTARIAQ